MAVKKKEKETTNVEVEVNVPEVNETEEVVEATKPVENTLEVEVVTEEPKQPEVEVDTEKAEVKVSNKPNGKVRIRMRVDHRCCIAMERYDLKAGETYLVPENVKNILNKAGLLAPL